MESLIYERSANSYYNFSDMNRVEDWIQFLKSQTNSLGFATVVKNRQTWNSASIPMQSDIDSIRSSITAIGNAIYETLPDDWIVLSVGETETDVHEWNAWEFDMHLIYETCGAMFGNEIFKQAGTMFMISGGVFS